LPVPVSATISRGTVDAARAAAFWKVSLMVGENVRTLEPGTSALGSAVSPGPDGRSISTVRPITNQSPATSGARVVRSPRTRVPLREPRSSSVARASGSRIRRACRPDTV
jgi:hypothetical protein